MLDELRQAFVGQLLFGVGCVASLRRTQPVTLDGFCQDDGRASLVFDGAFVGVINFRRIVAAAMQLEKLFIGLVLDQFQQLGILAPEILAQIFAVLGFEGLVVAVDALFHALHQQSPGGRARTTHPSPNPRSP